MARRTFLAASLSGIAAVALSSCTWPEPSRRRRAAPTATAATPTPDAHPDAARRRAAPDGHAALELGRRSVRARRVLVRRRRHDARAPRDRSPRRSAIGCSSRARPAIPGARARWTARARRGLRQPPSRPAARRTRRARRHRRRRSRRADGCAGTRRRRLRGRRRSRRASASAAASTRSTTTDFDQPIELGAVFVGDDERAPRRPRRGVRRHPARSPPSSRRARPPATPCRSRRRVPTRSPRPRRGRRPSRVTCRSPPRSSAPACSRCRTRPTPTGSAPRIGSPTRSGAPSSRPPARRRPGSRRRRHRPSRLGEPKRLVTGRLADYVDALAASVDVAVSSVVTRIAYDDRRVSLRLDSGESLTVDRAIVTVPLGVLKTDTLRFSPALPLLHQRAISVLGMGVVDIVWLRFESAFWRPRMPRRDGRPPPPPTCSRWSVSRRRSERGSTSARRRASPCSSGSSLRDRRLDSRNSTIRQFQAAMLADLAPYATAPD